MMMMTRGEERGGWTVCLYQWRTTIVQNINHIRYISNISKVLNDDDDKGGRNRRMDSRFVSMEDYLRIVNCNSSHQRADTDSVSKSVTPQSTYISFAQRL